MLHIHLGLMLLRPCYRFLVNDAADIPTATASAFFVMSGLKIRLIGLFAYRRAAAINFLSPFELHPLELAQSLSCARQAQSNASSHGALKSTPAALADCVLP